MLMARNDAFSISYERDGYRVSTHAVPGSALVWDHRLFSHATVMQLLSTPIDFVWE